MKHLNNLSRFRQSHKTEIAQKRYIASNMSPDSKTFFDTIRISTLGSPFMNAKPYFTGFAVLCLLPLLLSCGEKRHSLPVFTKTDSLTDTYLALKDSMLQSWNVMINDDNQKIEAMNDLLHELMVSGATSPELLKSFRERLEQLKNTRYTQKTMSNEDIVDEYDFASNALVSELITLTESQKQFAYNTTLQKLTDYIRISDQRVNRYREQYDQVTVQYNTFIEQNKNMLRDVDPDSFLEKKPLFQMASDDSE
jgi:hypothetical protein